jgi:hypothetical protein
MRSSSSGLNYDKKSWTDTGTDKTYGTAVMSLLEPRKECLPSRLPQAARKSPRHTDESAQILGPRSVSILNKMEPLPSLLYSMNLHDNKTESEDKLVCIRPPNLRASSSLLPNFFKIKMGPTLSHFSQTPDSGWSLVYVMLT